MVRKHGMGQKICMGVLDIPDEIKPFVGNYPMHLVEVVDNKLRFRNAEQQGFVPVIEFSIQCVTG